MLSTVSRHWKHARSMPLWLFHQGRILPMAAKVVLAAVQSAPVYLDLEASLEKAVRLIGETRN